MTKTNNSKRQTSSGKANRFAGRMVAVATWLPLCCFVAAGLWLLLCERYHFLLETAALTPFLTTHVFTIDMLSQIGGGLFWVSSLLQSCMAWPWLGSMLLLAVLVALAFAVKKVFRISDAWAGIAWIPSWMLLLNYLQLGYIVYVLKCAAVAFTLPVGLLLAVLLVGLWRMAGEKAATQSQHTKTRLSAGGWVLGVGCWVLMVCVGYWLAGFYVLFACLLFAVCCLAKIWRERHAFNDGKHWFGLLIPVLSLVLSAVVPPLFYRTRWFFLRADQLYWVGLPDYRWGSTEQPLFLPMLIAMAVLVLVACFSGRKPKESTAIGGYLRVAVSLLLFFGACIATWTHTYRDSNFAAILEMKHASEEGRWEDVLAMARQNDAEPTRAQVCLTRLALYKLGRMGNELFHYPEGSAGYHARRPYHYLQATVGRLLYYYYGKINFAYRWCMEDMVEYGMRPDYLRLMHRIAVLNGEDALAKKYADALNHTLFWKTGEETAATMSQHSEQKELQEPAELQAPKELMNYGDVLDGDAGLIEFYLLNSFALTDGGSREMVEVSMMHNLITKNLQAFWPRFFKLLPTWQGKIPTHYQEAALMIAQLQGHPELLRDVPIDAAIQARFERLVQASAQHGDDQEYNRTVLKPEFGDTYWYYYFFVEGLKTT